MDFKKVICIVCGQQVSKRSTLSMEEINGLPGRACREHDEVKIAIAQKEKRKKLEQSCQEAHEAIHVVAAVAFIRSMHTLHGTPVDFLLYEFRQAHKKRPDLIEKIETELKKQGPVISQKELDESLFSFALLMRQRNFAPATETSQSIH